MINPLVIVIAGPTGAGKTTLSIMLNEHFDCAHISEDEIAKEIFPDEYKNIEDCPDKVKRVESQLLKRAKEIFDSGKCVGIDLINLEKEFIEEMKKAFRKHLVLRILWPSMEITVERDKKREGWTSGEIAIKRFYKRYEELKPIIGEKNYIDSSHQTPQETFETFISIIEQNK